MPKAAELRDLPDDELLSRLESAKEDRLDFRLEVAELQQSPTSALGQVRRKWEQQQLLSRAEWVFLAQYIQVAL